jgi:hypothetical protein
MITLRRQKLGVCGLALFAMLGASGCRNQNVTISPLPAGFCYGEGEGIIVVYQWKDGPVAVICADVGGSSSIGSSFSGPPPVWSAKGTVDAKDGRQFDWLFESTDGKPIKYHVAGQEFDISKGTLFLVRTRGGKTEVEQINRDVSAVQPTAESCKEFAAKNPDVAKLLAKEGDK